MTRKLTSMTALLLPLTVLAGGNSTERMKANAQFLAEHPVVAKVLQRNTLPAIPMRNLVTKTLWQSPNRGPEHAALPEIWGNVIGADDWTGRYTAYGVYDFNPIADMNLNMLHNGTSENMKGNGGAVKIGNKYHLTYWYMGLGEVMSKYYVWNTDTWTLESQKNTNDGGLCATDLAYDRLNNICYGAFFTDDLSGWELATIDFSGATPVKTSIGRIPLMVAALGVNKAGEVYGICEDGVLYKFDTQTAAYTRIGDTGIKVGGYSGVVQQSGEFDQHSDIFYWVASDAYGRTTLYTVDVNTAEVTKIGDVPERAQILNMQVMAPKADDKAPGFIKDFVAQFANGSLSGNVSFTIPSYTYDGDNLTSVTYSIAANGKVLVSERAAAGSTVNENVTIEAGQNTLEVWVENSVGRSPVSDTIFWAGPDQPIMKEVNYTKNGNTSTVTWSVNETGVHGGWVGDLSYKVVRMPDEYVVAENTRENSITDVIPENAPLQLYKYVVTPTNGGLTGEPMTSNGNVVGNAVVPPYENTFDDATSMNLMETINNNKDKYSWYWDTQTYDNPNGVVKLSSGEDYSSSDYDDWLLTPEIRLEAGKTYELSFRARCTEYYNEMNLRVMMGPGLDVSKYEELIPKTNMAYKTSFKEYKASITPTKNESVRIGFHGTAQYAEGTLSIDDIRLTAGVLPTAPAAVTNLEIIPDNLGDLQATVKFNAPAVSHDGGSLTSISKIDIYCDNVLAKTVTAPTPGAEISEIIDVDKDGTHTFRLETFNESGAGDTASASSFVGVDIPTTFPAWLSEDGTNIIVSWEAPTTGANGRYINPDNLTYNIYNSDGMSLGELIAEGVTGTSYSILPGFGIDEDEQGMIILGMRAVNRAGMSRGVSTSSLIVGKPYDLPLVEHFDGTSNFYYEGDTNVDFNTATGAASDGDDCCFAWYYAGNSHDSYKELRTLKLGTNGTSNLRMTFDYKISGDGHFEIYVIKADGSRALAGTYGEVSADETWSKAYVDLSDYTSERYTRIAMRFVSGEGVYGIMMIDNICIQDAVEKDLVLDLNVTNTPIHYGETTQIIANVANKGLQTANEYTVALYANDEKIGEQTGTPLEFMTNKDYTFSYKVQPGAPQNIAIKAVVTYDGDEKPANNTKSKTLKVGAPKVSAPEDLTADVTDATHLTWKAPTEFYSETVTEDFESYTPWTIYNMGEWKLVDGDGAKVIGLGDADYPNEGVPQAFTIFNPLSIGVPEANKEAVPHSGSQYAACFAAKVSPTMERNDDWLISQLLPGTAQTISFWAKQMIPDYGAEKVEIMYSTTGREVSDFIKASEFTIDNYRQWTRFEAELPEGALYFAFHVVTRDGHMFMLDDVEFVAGSCREIVAWKIYRDGEFLTEVPADTMTYTDAVTDGHRYNVTAVYATGEESAFSNDFDTTGVEMIVDDNTLYNVYSLDGKVLQLNGKAIKGLEPGIYIINGEKRIIRR